MKTFKRYFGAIISIGVAMILSPASVVGYLGELVLCLLIFWLFDYSSNKPEKIERMEDIDIDIPDMKDKPIKLKKPEPVIEEITTEPDPDPCCNDAEPEEKEDPEVIALKKQFDDAKRKLEEKRAREAKTNERLDKANKIFKKNK